MEHSSVSYTMELLGCINPQLLDLVSESGHGVDDPHYNVRTHSSNESIDFEQSDALFLDVYHEPGAHEGPLSDEDADHESIDAFPLAPSYSPLDPEAPVFVPACQMELDNAIRIDTELGLELLQPTQSPTTPRIEVSAPKDFPPIRTDHAPRVTQKSRPQSRQSSPRGRSSSINRPRARSNSRKSSPIPKAMATKLITTLGNMPVNRQEPYTVGDRTAKLLDLHVHALFPPTQPSPYSSFTTLAPGALSQGYRCSHGGCAEYARVWDTRSERDHHERKHVPKDQRAHSCDYCGKTFHFPKDLNRHIIAVHHGTRVICPHCAKAYSRMDNLKRHIKTQHKYAQSSRSASQMSANSPTASTPVSYVQSPIDDTGHTTPLNLSPLAAKSSPWSKHNHHRHDSVNDPSTYECYSPSESPLFAQPMFKSYSNQI